MGRSSNLASKFAPRGTSNPFDYKLLGLNIYLLALVGRFLHLILFLFYFRFGGVFTHMVLGLYISIMYINGKVFSSCFLIVCLMDSHMRYI